MFKDAGNWWNDSSIQQIEKDGSVYALHGWNGEVYEECWKCTGKHKLQLEIIPIELKENINLILRLEV